MLDKVLNSARRIMMVIISLLSSHSITDSIFMLLEFDNLLLECFGTIVLGLIIGTVLMKCSKFLFEDEGDYED